MRQAWVSLGEQTQSKLRVVAVLVAVDLLPVAGHARDSGLSSVGGGAGTCSRAPGPSDGARGADAEELRGTRRRGIAAACLRLTASSLVYSATSSSCQMVTDFLPSRSPGAPVPDRERHGRTARPGRATTASALAAAQGTAELHAVGAGLVDAAASTAWSARGRARSVPKPCAVRSSAALLRVGIGHDVARAPGGDEGRIGLRGSARGAWAARGASAAGSDTSRCRCSGRPSRGPGRRAPGRPGAPPSTSRC